MAPSEHNEADETGPTFVMQRLVVNVLAVVALLVVLWALSNGGDRDTATEAAGALVPLITLLMP